ncbi:MAG: hypothetical protein A2Y40_03105 [Candidatus Margulisbacteria bacterium GWF2_35_9]|nr:MAG: hypothetical protein A2Y40_03105 [Candidatus Margulisbacteria bacterium GWF2_35_9]
MSNISIKNKLTLFICGIISIIIILIIIGVRSNNTISYKYDNVENLLKLNQFLDKKLNDHYEWMQGLTDQFIINKKFDKQLDPHKCGFGKWYYSFIDSDEYKLMPANVRETFNKLEEPHRKLHESGEKIRDNYTEIDLKFEGLLTQKQVDHLLWLNSLRDTFQHNTNIFTKTTNPRECAFGKWYYSFIDSDMYKTLPADIKALLSNIELNHKKLHLSAEDILAIAGTNKKITDPAKIKQARELYNKKSLVYADELMRDFNILKVYISDLSKKKEATIQIYIEESKVQVDIILKYFRTIQEYINKQVDQAGKEASSTKNRSKSMLLVVSFIGIVLTIFSAILLNRSVLKPLNKTVDIMKDIAEGDGDLRIKMNIVRNDEIGKLAKYFNAFIEKIATTVKVSQGTCSAVNTESYELTSIVNQIVDGVGSINQALGNILSSTQSQNECTSEMEEKMEGVTNVTAEAQILFERQVENSNEGARVMEQISNAVNAITINISAIASSSVLTTQTSKEGMEKVQESVNAIHANSVKFSQISDQIQVLNSNSEQIGTIISVIEDIASQTNLLALNAAIEAARAGEYGKGFAVVAEEVRKLAERSANATTEISTLIKNIQKATAESVTAMEEGSNNVKMAVEKASNAKDSLNEICTAVQSNESQIEDISAASEEVSASVSEAVSIINSLKNSVETTSKKIALSTEYISEVNMSLRTVVDSSQTNAAAVQEINASMEEISASMDNEKSATERLMKEAVTLESKLNEFKV